MGNCLRSPEHVTNKKRCTINLQQMECNQNYVNLSQENTGCLDQGDIESAKELETDLLPCQASSSNALNHNKDPSWLRFLSQNKPGSALSDDEECSIFGENWDPELFDQRVRSPITNGQSDMTDRLKISKAPLGTWKNWNSEESLGVKLHSKGTKLIVLSSSILGFSQYPSEPTRSMNWFRNGELESPQPNANGYLIKSKNPTTEANCNTESPTTCQDNSIHDGWLRYTVFLHQDKSDIYTFYGRFRTAKHIFVSLETKTGCEIRISKRLFVYRGKLVRILVIDGPSRKNIIRCYSSLPDVIQKLLICECERPSLVEPRPLYRLEETRFTLPPVLQQPMVY